MGCLVKSEASSKSTEISYVPQPGADAVQRSNRDASNHPQLFDARKHIPVFLSTAQAQIPVPNSSGNYTSISSISYDHSVISSKFTRSSGLSTPLPIIDYKPCNESKTNAFSNLLKKLHRDISHLEEMMLLVDSGECRDKFSDDSDDASVISSTFSSSATDGLSAPSPIFDHHPRDEDGDDASISSASSYAHSVVSSTFSSSATDGLSAPSPIFDRDEDRDNASVSSVSSHAHSIVSSTFSSSATDGLSTPSPLFDYVLEDLHRGISHLEMIVEMLLADSDLGEPQDESCVVIKGGPSDGADEVENA
jgi:hypothetical protein